VATVAVGLVSGCSEPDKPGTLPSTTPVSTSSTASPSPSPSTPEQQVEAAVRTYYAELARAIRTSSTSKLEPLLTRGCPCYGSVTAIKKQKVHKRRAPGTQIVVTSVKVHDVIQKTAAAEVTYDVNAYDVVGSDGKVFSHVPARRDRVDLSFVMRGDAWILTNLFNLGAR
jgi:hypothetical protein